MKNFQTNAGNVLAIQYFFVANDKKKLFIFVKKKKPWTHGKNFLTSAENFKKSGNFLTSF